MTVTAEDAIREKLKRGAELYNADEFWHAHEAWEDAWLALQDQGDDAAAAFVQGLILMTAAFENLQRGKPMGFATQGAKALHRFREHEGHGTALGLANEAAFRDAFLTLYLAVQRRKIQTFDDLPLPPPELDITA